MHANGTSRLDKLTYLSCQCPICINMTVREFIDLEYKERTDKLAKHNLYILRGEILSVKQAIMEGRLWEYVGQKARAHPKLMEAYKLFLNYKYLEDGTPVFKKKAIFFMETFDQYRPEASRIRNIFDSFRTNKKKIILYPDTQVSPFYSSREYHKLYKKFSDYQICSYNPFIGIIPAEISDIYPAAHNLISKKKFNLHNAKDYPTFMNSFEKLLSHHYFDEIIIIEDEFMKGIVHETNTEHKNLKIIEYTDDVLEDVLEKI